MPSSENKTTELPLILQLRKPCFPNWKGSIVAAPLSCSGRVAGSNPGERNTTHGGSLCRKKLECHSAIHSGGGSKKLSLPPILSTPGLVIHRAEAVFLDVTMIPKRESKAGGV